MNRTTGAVLTALLLTIMTGCGLPSYTYLDAPSRISYYTNQVGFTAADDSGVDGYMIYYKIYEYNATEKDDDEDRFDASYYDDDSIPNGTTVPDMLGFKKMGWINASSIATPQIPYTGNGEVRIDFSSSINQDSAADPSLYIENSLMSSSIGIPARGVKFSNNTYKRFVKNYDLDDSDVSSSASSWTSIHIAFVAISYGLDPSSLESSMSVPVYLGTVYQYSFDETDIETLYPN